MIKYIIQNHRLFIILSLLILCQNLAAQIKGNIRDASTKEPLSFISIFYEGTTTGTNSGLDGNFTLPVLPGHKEFVVSSVGYKSQKFKIVDNKEYKILLQSDEVLLDEVVVKPVRQKYKRKNNPAVELMRKVIENKRHFEISQEDFYEYNKYQKMKTSLNDLTEDKIQKGLYKSFKLQADRLEKSEISDNYIFPISVQETSTKVVYRKDPKIKREYIEGTRTSGLDTYLASGELITTMIADVFTDINIYDNEIKMLNRRFVSPISNNAISFYQYFIMDTVKIDNADYIHLTFVPQNSLDFGFTGHIYITNDSNYSVKSCQMRLPYNNGVNFVSAMSVTQEFEPMADGRWALKRDIMTADLELTSFIQGVQIERMTLYDDYEFNPIPEEMFKSKAAVVKVPEAGRRDEEYWAQYRQERLSENEETVSESIEQISQSKPFKYVLFVASLLFENYTETAPKGKVNKFDIGPINTFISSNYIDGTRFRFGGRTTAGLNPHWFLTGYGAYGLKDHRWKYSGELTYAFKAREFYPWEYPMHNISVAYKSEVESPMDKFLDTDKDNVFVALKAFPVDQMLYVRQGMLKYQFENYSGMLLTVEATRKHETPAGKLQFLKNDGLETPVQDLVSSQIGATFRFAPGERFVNTKQRRKLVNKDVPVFAISHTTGVKGFMGSNFNSNITELSTWNRFWMGSWGKLDAKFKAGLQWNTVPFPLLIIPTANLSYTSQNNEAFNLMRNMEFLNDRYVSLSLIYDMNGKLFNRIPLFNRLKWREIFKVKALWGTLTDKNNPYISTNPDIFKFPTRNGEPSSFVMDKKKPYVEATVGIYNIFKLLQIEYVRRLTYLDNPGATKQGIRILVQMGF